jgi:hypothetical protein
LATLAPNCISVSPFYVYLKKGTAAVVANGVSLNGLQTSPKLYKNTSPLLSLQYRVQCIAWLGNTECSLNIFV